MSSKVIVIRTKFTYLFLLASCHAVDSKANYSSAGCSLVQKTAPKISQVHSTKLVKKPGNAAAFAFDKPSNRTVDINIGTNYQPMKQSGSNYLILVDPLPDVCQHLNEHKLSWAKDEDDISVYCCAISNYTGSATFHEYSKHLQGQSSSLAKTTDDSSGSPGMKMHSSMNETGTHTVIVLEAASLFQGLVDRGNKLYKLKLDMQGFDLTTLLNMQDVLADADQATHIMAECFIANERGHQIYQVDNSCESMMAFLQELGYSVKLGPHLGRSWTDVYAFKFPATDYLSAASWAPLTADGRVQQR